MKKSILLGIVFSLLYSMLHSQNNFEGIIKFKVEYKDKTAQMSQKQIKQLMGNEQTYYLKKEKYKSELNGLLKMTTFYNGNDTLFLKTSMNNSLMYSLVTEEVEEKIISHEFTDTTETIAGVKCKLVIVKTTKGIHKYYYSNDVRIDPKYYENHKTGMWNFFMKITNGGISIRSVSDLKDSYNSIEAVLIERKTLNDTIFNRPNLPITEMVED